MRGASMIVPLVFIAVSSMYRTSRPGLRMCVPGQLKRCGWPTHVVSATNVAQTCDIHGHNAWNCSSHTIAPEDGPVHTDQTHQRYPESVRLAVHLENGKPII